MVEISNDGLCRKGAADVVRKKRGVAHEGIVGLPSPKLEIASRRLRRCRDRACYLFMQAVGLLNLSGLRSNQLPLSLRNFCARCSDFRCKEWRFHGEQSLAYIAHRCAQCLVQTMRGRKA